MDDAATYAKAIAVAAGAHGHTVPALSPCDDDEVACEASITSTDEKDPRPMKTESCHAVSTPRFRPLAGKRKL